MSVPKPELNEVNHAELGMRIANGDREAEHHFVRLYQRPVLEMLRRRTRDEQLSEDLLQETLIVCLRRLREGSIDDPSRLSAFVHRVALNLAIGNFRKEARHNTQVNSKLVELQRDETPSSLERLLAEERTGLVRKLLAELTVERDREILTRFYTGCEDKGLICQAMGLNAEQFDRVISRARQRFKSLVYEKLRWIDG